MHIMVYFLFDKMNIYPYIRAVQSSLTSLQRRLRWWFSVATSTKIKRIFTLISPLFNFIWFFVSFRLLISVLNEIYNINYSVVFVVVERSFNRPAGLQYDAVIKLLLDDNFSGSQFKEIIILFLFFGALFLLKQFYILFKWRCHQSVW